jgi:hypothetical protein
MVIIHFASGKALIDLQNQLFTLVGYNEKNEPIWIVEHERQPLYKLLVQMQDGASNFNIFTDRRISTYRNEVKVGIKQQRLDIEL